jgi:hypothetical protein
MDERIAFFHINETATSMAIRTVAVAALAHKAAAARQTNGAAKRGPVGHIQAKLATAIKQDPDWKEF